MKHSEQQHFGFRVIREQIWGIKGFLRKTTCCENEYQKQRKERPHIETFI